ncbi:patatin [Fulvivirga maritima]|uniref:patatin n=1 Tax=Fulvivirga maritima TaxID=2904247 RepID=UPI001F21BA9A|nr:patatin [Fulvivirga maritima]UII25978.1 patatin [Fulvivirga maritima]
MNKWLNILIVLISLATLASGLFQMIAPAVIMNLIEADITAASAHFFRIVGMFMFLFGGLMLHTIYSEESGTIAVLWAALQKLGAFLGVGIGITIGIFSWLALSVALFDLFSGILFLYYYKKIR